MLTKYVFKISITLTKGKINKFPKDFSCGMCIDGNQHNLL